jgi:hypothetical protein
MPFKELDWEQLLDFIDDGTVVPVIGDELHLSPRGSDGRTLDEEVVEKLAQQLGVAPASYRSVRQLAHDYSKNDAQRREVFRSALKRVFRHVNRVPPALEQLASIKDFRLYISATPSTMIADVLSRRRLGGEGRCSETHFAPNSSIRPDGVPQENVRDLRVPHVFYPFGSFQGTKFAVTEEDTLDYLCHLFAEPKLASLLASIKQCHLLFIGCNFPDWLTRFWIRALAGDQWLPGGREHVEYIADQTASTDESLIVFLDRMNVRGSNKNASDFVAELHDRWQGRRKLVSDDDPLPPEPDNPYVFISYAHEDQARAQMLYQRLDAKGVTAWLDTKHLEPGYNVQRELRHRIERCTLFMPILSEHVRRAKGYFREEWSHARACAGRLNTVKRPFILPVVVDDLPDRDFDAGAPDEFWDVSYRRIRDGAASDDFCSYVKQLIRRAQV